MNCEDCKWWGGLTWPRIDVRRDWGECHCDRTRRRTGPFGRSFYGDRSVPYTHKNFGCIHFEPEDDSVTAEDADDRWWKEPR